MIYAIQAFEAKLRLHLHFIPRHSNVIFSWRWAVEEMCKWRIFNVSQNYGWKETLTLIFNSRKVLNVRKSKENEKNFSAFHHERKKERKTSSPPPTHVFRYFSSFKSIFPHFSYTRRRVTWWLHEFSHTIFHSRIRFCLFSFLPVSTFVGFTRLSSFTWNFLH